MSKENEMIDVVENETVQIDEEKNTVLSSVNQSVLKDYMTDFKDVVSKLDVDIDSLKSKISSIKEEIDRTNEELNKKVEDINLKEQEEKDKIKDSSDYTSNSLMESAKVLEKLSEEKKNLEETLKEKINEFNQNVDELEEKKSLKEKVKNNVVNIANSAEKKMSDLIVEYTKKIDAINAALDICDNEFLKKALTEEKEKMEKYLNETKTTKFNEVNKEMEVLEDKKQSVVEPVKEEIKPVEVQPIEIPKFEKRPEIEEKVETQEKVVLETKMPEINIESEKVEQPKIDENKFIDKDREVIQVDSVPSDKVEQIKHSTVIRDGLKSFFQSINSGLVIPSNQDEAKVLKTIEDDNVKNASYDDMYYVGAIISSVDRVDIYSSIDDLQMRFNPERDHLTSRINSIVLLDKNKIINESSNNGTILSDLKYSSGVDKKDIDVALKTDAGYVLYNPYEYSLINEEEKRMKVGM